MKKIGIILLLFISLSSFSQQIVRGYTASFSYGFLSKGDDLLIHYEGVDYTATASKSVGSCISLGFPFDMGYNRHRFVFTPGLDFLTSNYTLDLDNDIPAFGSDSDSIKLSSFMIIPQIGLMYKYHFYVSKLHFALGVGIDLKIPVSNNITLNDKAKTELIVYSETPLDYEDHMVFTDNTVYSNLADLGFHVNPKFGFDIYVSKFLVTNIFYTSSPLTTYTDKPVFRGYGGFGATYLIPFGKEDDSRILQYYKQ